MNLYVYVMYVYIYICMHQDLTKISRFEECVYMCVVYVYVRC